MKVRVIAWKPFGKNPAHIIAEETCDLFNDPADCVPAFIAINLRKDEATRFTIVGLDFYSNIDIAKNGREVLGIK